MANRYVEDRHEAKVARRVVDVRPAGTQYAEWLTERFNLLIVILPHLVLAGMFPLLAPVLLLSALGHMTVHVSTKTILPFRYPAANPEPDPSSKKGKRGNGIMLVGNVDADSEYERFKEIWQSDDDLRKHMLIIGSTGSGKSETLKGIFFNALCWSSGFFVADGKADNKLPTDTFTMVNSFGRGDDLLFLNFLLGGRTPEQVRKSRRRRTNKINPISSADADTIIQMGANMLPKVEGEGKNWQEKALNLWRALVVALCYLRDTEGMDLSVATLIEYMALPKIEELFIKGYEESLRLGEWSYGFAGIKAYLDTGCPAYKVDKLLAKHGFADTPPPAPGRPAAGGKAHEQDSMAYEQHAYRTTQLMPVLNLLDKTYGFIFRDKYPEIDMIDVTLNNRILVMLIPSLEKSAQEAENLGKLAIACLRVMMGKNLGSEIEGTRNDLLNSKATAAPYPYPVALDELAYYFADGIAVMFAQARSLGFQMIAAAQDLEKLTEGSRAAEAGAMLANQVAKVFMRIDDANKTYEFITKILGKIDVAMRSTFELGGVAYKRSKEIVIQQIERVTLREMQEKGPGEAVFNSAGKTVRMKSFYVGDDLEEHKAESFHVLRFLQVEPPSAGDIELNATPVNRIHDPVAKGNRLLEALRYQRERSDEPPPPDLVISAVAQAAASLNQYTRAPERAIALYQAAKEALLKAQGGSPGGVSGGAAAERAPALRVDEHAIASGEATLAHEPARSALPPRVSLPTGVAPGQVAVQVDDDEGIAVDDPLGFLGTPFERKPAEVLLKRAESKLVLEEAGATGDSALPEDNPVLRFLRAGKTLKLRRPEAEDEKGAEEATMRALAGIAPAAEDSDDWVSQAVAGANEVLAAKSAEGKTVVGFSDPTASAVAGIEELLGSPDPEGAASRLEAVVSAQVTPDVRPDAQYKVEDIADFFERLTAK